MAGRALVLGGGGITGIAWELGMLAGLHEAGIDLTDADRVIGTSAGSVVGAQLTSGLTLEALYAGQLEPPEGELGAELSRFTLLRFVLASIWPGDEQQARARLGRMALRARTVPEADRRQVIAERLVLPAWPDDDRLCITAVVAETGEFVAFDRTSGAPLIDAVAASCAVPLVWPPMTVSGRRYIDGGVRSITNADLATGCDRVVVIAPIRQSLRKSGRISTQLASLGPGVRSVVLSPDDQARRVMGRNVLDPAFRAASARAGRAQARSVAAQVAAVWAS